MDPAGDYLAIRQALAETAAVAGELADDRIGTWLSDQAVVLTTMAAAVAVVESAGLAVDRGDDAVSHLNRARYWHSYSAGPVLELHRRCGRDISRGSLRLYGACRPAGSDVRVELHRTRLHLIGAGRARWAALRRELQAEPVGGRTSRAGYEQHVRAELRRLFTATDLDSARELCDVVGVPTTPWSMPIVPDPSPGPGTDERRLAVVLGAGFGLGVALATMRLASGLAGVGQAGGAALGLVVGVILTGWMVVTRGRLQARAGLDRWVAEAVAVVRQAAEDQLACRWVDVQQHLARAAPPAHHKSRN